MKSGKKLVSDVIDRIITLRQEIKEKQEELKHLESTPLQEKSPAPEGFDYKDAILKLANEKPDSIFKIDSIMDYIYSKYDGFVADRGVVSIRVSYLADIVKKLERVEGKRGFYRLKKVI